MNAHADTIHDTSSKIVANRLSVKQFSGKSSLEFVDNRTGTIVQRNLQEMADNFSAQRQPFSPQVDHNPVAQMKWIPKVTESARKHYGDGWGDAYGIKSDQALIDEVAHGDTEEGVQEIPLGKQRNPYEYISKYCNILFSNWTGSKGDEMTKIFHCGPGREG
jgi:hypothetical protein